MLQQETTIVNKLGLHARASAKLTMEQAYLELRFALGLGPIDDTEPAK